MSEYIKDKSKIDDAYEFVGQYNTLDQYFKDDFLPPNKTIMEYRPKFKKHTLDLKDERIYSKWDEKTHNNLLYISICHHSTHKTHPINTIITFK